MPDKEASIETSLISVVMPVFNRRLLIPETVESIIAQTYNNWELFLVDDGSDKATVSLLKNYALKDKRIKLIERSRQPKGAQTCRNLGFEKAQGSFIVFMDSDDLLETFSLQQRVSFMNDNPQLDFAIFPGLLFHKEKFDKNILVSGYKGKDIISMLLGLTPPGVPGNMVWKRSSLKAKNIVWDEKVEALQDVDFHLLAAYNNLSFGYANAKPDFFWRKHNEGNTGSELSKPDKLASHEYFFKKQVDVLKEKNLYDKYKPYLSRLAGQLILVSFQSGNTADVPRLAAFLQQFGKPFTELSLPLLSKLGSFYKRGSFLKAFARISVFLLYPSIFPLFKNKDFAKLHYPSPQ